MVIKHLLSPYIQPVWIKLIANQQFLGWPKISRFKGAARKICPINRCILGLQLNNFSKFMFSSFFAWAKLQMNRVNYTYLQRCRFCPKIIGGSNVFKTLFDFNLEYFCPFSKSTWGEQPVENITNFTCICVYLLEYLLCHSS